jgi:hypothetical protein
MPFHYREKRLSSALNALQKYITVQKLTQCNLENMVKSATGARDLTEAFNSIIFRLSKMLTAEVTGITNQYVRIRQIGKLRLNHPLFLPTPKELKWGGYNTKEINHRITGNGVIRRMS